jgi:hypothetical protein
MMKMVVVRIKTYDNWLLSFMYPQEMAVAVLYYTGYGDLFRCPFCKILLGYWEAGDYPRLKHQQQTEIANTSQGPLPQVPSPCNVRVLL